MSKLMRDYFNEVKDVKQETIKASKKWRSRDLAENDLELKDELIISQEWNLNNIKKIKISLLKEEIISVFCYNQHINLFQIANDIDINRHKTDLKSKDYANKLRISYDSKFGLLMKLGYWNGRYRRIEKIKDCVTK